MLCCEEVRRCEERPLLPRPRRCLRPAVAAAALEEAEVRVDFHIRCCLLVQLLVAPMRVSAPV